MNIYYTILIVIMLTHKLYTHDLNICVQPLFIILLNTLWTRGSNNTYDTTRPLPSVLNYFA